MTNIRYTCFYVVRHGVETLAYFQEFKNAQAYYAALETRLKRFTALEYKWCANDDGLNANELEESLKLVEEIESMGGSVYMEDWDLYVEELNYRD